jgi:hypothetical protein
VEFPLFLFAPAVAVLWHEAAHAAFALALTRGTVTLVVGLGPSVPLRLGRLTLRIAPLPLGGLCRYDSTERPGDRALIAAAGPVASVFLAALAWSLAPRFTPVTSLVWLAQSVAVTSGIGAVLTMLPLRYSPAAFPGGGESDGLVVLRALFPASMLAINAPTGPRFTRRPARPLRWPFMLVLAVVTPVAFMVSVWVGLWMALLFGFAYLDERR